MLGLFKTQPISSKALLGTAVLALNFLQSKAQELAASNDNTGTIVGIAVGSAAALACCTFCCYKCIKRCKAREENRGDYADLADGMAIGLSCGCFNLC